MRERKDLRPNVRVTVTTPGSQYTGAHGTIIRRRVGQGLANKVRFDDKRQSYFADSELEVLS